MEIFNLLSHNRNDISVRFDLVLVVGVIFFFILSKNFLKQKHSLFVSRMHYYTILIYSVKRLSSASKR